MNSEHTIYNEVFEAIQRERKDQPLSLEERAVLCERIRVSEQLDAAPDEELYGIYVLGAAEHHNIVGQ